MGDATTLSRKPGHENSFVLSGMFFDLSPADRRALLDDWYTKLQATLAERNKQLTDIFKDMVRKVLEGLPDSSDDPSLGGYMLQRLRQGRVERVEL